MGKPCGHAVHTVLLVAVSAVSEVKMVKTVNPQQKHAADLHTDPTKHLPFAGVSGATSPVSICIVTIMRAILAGCSNSMLLVTA